MKKRVFIQHGKMYAGGTETSLLNFVESMKDVCDIKVLLFCGDGILQERLEKTGCQILLGSPKMKELYESLPSISGKTEEEIHAFINKVDKEFINEPSAKGEYDAAFSFNCRNYMTNQYVLKCVGAKKKYAITHRDPDHNALTVSTQKCLPEFDMVFCVAESLSEKVPHYRPDLYGKIDTLMNFQDVDGIKAKAKLGEGNLFDARRTNFISPIRLNPEKAPMRMARVILELAKDKKTNNFTWTVLGDGVHRKELEEFIRQNGLEKHISYIGPKTNPYPYISASDFLLLGSLNEAAPMVYGEAHTLGVPVVTTNISSAKELVGKHGGLVCDNSEQGIYDALREVLTSKEKLTQMKAAVKDFEYPNKQIKEKVLEYI